MWSHIVYSMGSYVMNFIDIDVLECNDLTQNIFGEM